MHKVIQKKLKCKVTLLKIGVAPPTCGSLSGISFLVKFCYWASVGNSTVGRALALVKPVLCTYRGFASCSYKWL